MFYDIHCHILPGVDDGSRDKEESMEMADIAVAQGILGIITTPHHLPRSKNTSRQEVLNRIEDLNSRIEEKKLNIDLFPGMENNITPDLHADIKNGEALFLGDSQFILIETPFSEFTQDAKDSVLNCLENKITPILAHPERNTDLQINRSGLSSLVRKGVLVQVNTGSFMGHYGEEAQRLAFELLHANLIHFVATDAHSSSGKRIPNMRDCFEIIKREVNESTAWKLTRDNPISILKNEKVKK